jgi:hypothetical protein
MRPEIVDQLYPPPDWSRIRNESDIVKRLHIYDDTVPRPRPMPPIGFPLERSVVQVDLMDLISAADEIERLREFERELGDIMRNRVRRKLAIQNWIFGMALTIAVVMLIGYAVVR